MPRDLDLSVYLVADPALCAGRGLVETVRLAVAGGATLVQLRNTRAMTQALVEEARALVGLLRPRGVPLVINDRVEVALAAGADGVHLGQDDMDARDARRLLGADAVIGLSVGNLSELEASRQAIPAVDYLGTGPFHATGSKADAGAAIGEAGIAAVRAAVDKPMVAIGGIDATNAGAAIRAGADGVAVVSAICAAADPRAAARQLAAAVNAARRR